jgi:hypothetical protein
MSCLQTPPKTSEQWHLLGSECVWDHTMGERIVIAIMDTGCDLSHPDLAPNAWINKAEIPGNGIDDDGNGFVDDVYGWNFGDKNADVTDNNGHGTHVASIVAAAGVSRVSGVAPGASIMCLKVQDKDGRLFASYMFSAYQYALDMGAHIVVNSFSNTYWSVPTEAASAHCDSLMPLKLPALDFPLLWWMDSSRRSAVLSCSTNLPCRVCSLLIAPVLESSRFL